MEAYEHTLELNCISSLTTLGNVIITSWEMKVRSALKQAKPEDKLLLKDHLPQILFHLKLFLEDKISIEDAKILGKLHGLLLTRFCLVDLMSEYSILREVLIFNLYPIGNLNGSTKLHRFIDELLISGATEYLKQPRL